MTDLSLGDAQAILAAGLAHSRKSKFNPVAIAVLDARGALKAFAAEDGVSLKRAEIAHGKAYGALALGMGSRSLFKRAKEQPFFIAALGPVVGGSLVPVPGGVLIRDSRGALIGAVGVSGDSSENDETAASQAIIAVGMTPDCGED